MYLVIEGYRGLEDVSLGVFDLIFRLDLYVIGTDVEL